MLPVANDFAGLMAQLGGGRGHAELRFDRGKEAATLRGINSLLLRKLLLRECGAGLRSVSVPVSSTRQRSRTELTSGLLAVPLIFLPGPLPGRMTIFSMPDLAAGVGAGASWSFERLARRSMCLIPGGMVGTMPAAE